MFNWSEKKNGTSLHVRMKNLVREKKCSYPSQQIVVLSLLNKFYKKGAPPQGLTPHPFMI